MWARVVGRAHSHPKFLALDPAAIGLWTMGLSYCGDQLTDGFIPRAQVAKLVSAPAGRTLKLAADLVKHGLWEARGGWVSGP
jgi:hypothetical protein